MQRTVTAYGIVLVFGIVLFICLGLLGLQKSFYPSLLLDDAVGVANYFLKKQHMLHQLEGDPLQISRMAGLITKIGALIWWSGGMVCLFAFCLDSKDMHARYFFFTGLLSLFMSADDLLLFHEYIE